MLFEYMSLLHFPGCYKHQAGLCGLCLGRGGQVGSTSSLKSTVFYSYYNYMVSH